MWTKQKPKIKIFSTKMREGRKNKSKIKIRAKFGLIDHHNTVGLACCFGNVYNCIKFYS